MNYLLVSAATLFITLAPPDLGSDSSWANYLTAYPEVRQRIENHEKWVKALSPDKTAWVELADAHFDADPLWAREMLSFLDAQTASTEVLTATRALDQFLGDNRIHEAAELAQAKLLLNDGYARAWRDLVSAMAEAQGFEYHIQCWNHFHTQRVESDIVFNTSGRGGIETYRRQYPGASPLWQPCLDFLDRNPAVYDAARRYFMVLKGDTGLSGQVDRLYSRLRQESNEVMLVEIWRLRLQIARHRDFWVRFLNHERARASRGDSAPALLRIRREFSADSDTAARLVQFRKWALGIENLSRRMHVRRVALREASRPVILSQLPSVSRP
ncbi:MAG: hypothetical protein KIT79_02520 [Deltaproteobacteria bacterium]|nr:hypothetical protein [Deltaproteobacteria bacterium]